MTDLPETRDLFYPSEPEQIELYAESDARRDLVAAQMEREQLLSRYQPDESGQAAK